MVSKVSCGCEIRPEGGFQGWDEFDAFVKALKADPSFMPIPVGKPYSNVGFVESWYRCTACLAIWRLVEPDPPFVGLWEKVDETSVSGL